MSGTQIWIGRSPCLRSLSRCSRTFSREDFAPEGFVREDLGFDVDAMTNSLFVAGYFVANARPYVASGSSLGSQDDRHGSQAAS